MFSAVIVLTWHIIAAQQHTQFIIFKNHYIAAFAFRICQVRGLSYDPGDHNHNGYIQSPKKKKRNRYQAHKVNLSSTTFPSLLPSMLRCNNMHPKYVAPATPSSEHEDTVIPAACSAEVTCPYVPLKSPLFASHTGFGEASVF